LVSDGTAYLWLTCFDQIGQRIFGINAENYENERIKQIENGDEIHPRIAKNKGKLINCEVKRMTSDIGNLFYSIQDLQISNFVEMNKCLIKRLEFYNKKITLYN